MPRQSYAKVVSTVDDHMGRIMARLREHGLREPSCCGATLAAAFWDQS